MSDVTKGTLDEVKSMNEKEKANLVNLAVTAANDFIHRKGRRKKPKQTTVILTEKDGISYQVNAINEYVSPGDWYKAILKSIDTLQKHVNIGSETLNELSSEQAYMLRIKLQELTPRLEELILWLNNN